MRSSKKYVVSLLLLLFSSITAAGSADLELEIRPDSFSNLGSGSVGEFEIVVINNGPDEAGADSPINFSISLNTEILFDDGSFNIGFSINNNIYQDCIFIPTVVSPRPGDPQGIVYSFFIDTIPANDSVTCYGRFQVFDEIFASAIEWRIINPSDTDTDDTNNRINMGFFGLAINVPALSDFWLLVLILLTYSIVLFLTYAKKQ